MPKNQAPECCTGCLNWERFKHECWVYWESKKNCTQHSSSQQGFTNI
ncbi:MAG TPA: hypothetical protein VJI46_01180 [Candidatus Nanoarchaeia archaeon]|nr:hypothetical protein [Candidatus Nanoarchaeia archaeon]